MQKFTFWTGLTWSNSGKMGWLIKKPVELSLVRTFVSSAKSLKQKQWCRMVLQKSVVSAVSVLKQGRL